MRRSEYTAVEVEDLLKHGQMSFERDYDYPAGLSYLTVWDSFRHRNTPVPYSPDLSPGNQIYYGPMYLQGNQPTCSAWSMANAITALGLNPRADVIRDLLNRKLLGRKFDFQEDMPALVSTLEADGFRGEYLEVTAGNPKRDSWDKLWAHYGFTAHFIFASINKRVALVAYVSSNYYGLSPEHSRVVRHALALVGYDIESSYPGMVVQTLDSNLGNIWLPVSLIANSAQAYLYLSYKGEEPRVDWYQKPEIAIHRIPPEFERNAMAPSRRYRIS